MYGSVQSPASEAIANSMESGAGGSAMSTSRATRTDGCVRMSRKTPGGGAWRDETMRERASASSLSRRSTHSSFRRSDPPTR
jgi:hypothetical protein